MMLKDNDLDTYDNDGHDDSIRTQCDAIEEQTFRSLWAMYRYTVVELSLHGCSIRLYMHKCYIVNIIEMNRTE